VYVTLSSETGKNAGGLRALSLFGYAGVLLMAVTLVSWGVVVPAVRHPGQPVALER
jgi:hypothetical protein